MESDERADEFLEHLNTIEPGRIVFTIEQEEGGSISVLDLKQDKRNDGTTACSVNYKKTHTNINIKGRSSHTEYVKRQ